MDMESEHFIKEHAQRTTERMSADLIKALVDKLDGETIFYNGHECRIRRFGDNGVDIINPDATFDHVEIVFTQTGWGRNV